MEFVVSVFDILAYPCAALARAILFTASVDYLGESLINLKSVGWLSDELLHACGDMEFAGE